MGDQEFGSTRQDVPLSMMALAYGVLVRLLSSTGGAQKCRSSCPAYLRRRWWVRKRRGGGVNSAT